jgi:hypothetical protein
MLVSDPSSSEVKIANTKLKKYRFPGRTQILAEVIKAGGEILLSAIHKFINSIWSKEELPDLWKEFIIMPI